jgi:hypothetical protein
MKRISPCRVHRTGTAVTLAPWLFLIFCATLFLNIQQPQYLADGDVSKVTCFPEMMTQVPKSLYCQCLSVTETCEALSGVFACHSQDCLAAPQVHGTW